MNEDKKDIGDNMRLPCEICGAAWTVAELKPDNKCPGCDAKVRLLKAKPE